MWHRLAEHLWLSALCLALSCLIALPVALWLGHLGKGGALAVNLSNMGRAVPTFAVLVLLTLSPLGRHGDWPTVIALVLFAVPPLLTNAYLGMREADRDVVEAARGMGMSGPQLLLRVEIPLAYPLIMTGLRSATVQVVATATLAALAGRRGPGPDHHRGLRQLRHGPSGGGRAAGGRARPDRGGRPGPGGAVPRPDAGAAARGADGPSSLGSACIVVTGRPGRSSWPFSLTGPDPVRSDLPRPG